MTGVPVLDRIDLYVDHWAGSRPDAEFLVDGGPQVTGRRLTWIDARAEIDTCMRQIVILMIEMECALKVAETGLHIPAQIDVFNQALQRSDAWKFVLGAAPSSDAV